jgi:hypothetical protein
MYLKNVLILASWVFLGRVNAQDVDQLLNQSPDSTINYTTATFKSTRIVSGHSIERMPAGQLDVRIAHRFGQLNEGFYNLWGLDEANTHLGLEYGITNWVMAGIGRGTYEKAYDGFLKFSILRQSTGRINMPVSLSYFSSIAINSTKLQLPGPVNFWMRASYVQQILVARKFNERFSFELNPTFIHMNMVTTAIDPNDIFAIGGGARFKLTTRVSINGEYYYIIRPNRSSTPYYNPLSIGFDIETGGHVFQFHLTNSLAMIEKGFVAQTQGNWGKGDVHLGFNISRVFTLK